MNVLNFGSVNPGAWPWPLDGVQEWFEGLYNYVSTAAFDAVRWLLDEVWSKLQWLKARVEDSVGWVWSQIKPLLGPVAEFVEKAAAWAWESLWAFLEDPVAALRTGFDAVAAKVRGFLADLWTSVQAGFDAASASFKGWIDGLWSNISGAIGGAVDAVKTALDGGVKMIGGWVQDALRGVAEALGEGLRGFWDWILRHLTGLAQMIVGAVNAVIAAIQGFITGLIKRFIEGITGAVAPGSPPQELETAINVMVESVTTRTFEIIEEAYASPPASPAVLPAAVKLVATLTMAKTVSEAAAAAGDAAHPIKQLQLRSMVASLVDSLGVGAMVTAITLLPVTVGLVTPLRYWYQETFTPYIPREDALTRMAAERLITLPEYYRNMRKHGFNAFWSDLMLQAAWRVPSYPELREMVWRGTISMETLLGALRVMGVREDFMPGYEDLVRRIPGPGDLITMVVREVITPEDFARYMPMQGFYPPWPEYFWEMHWILLPLGEVRRARHRGFIDDEELGRFLVLHDYKPEPRPGIRTSDRDLAAKLVWDLPGRIDARWMFRWGRTDRDGLKDLLIKGGLDPEYADDVADAVAMNQFLREIRAQETNIKADLRDGFITEAVARADLKELGYPPAFVEYHIADALRDRERRHKKELLDYYRDCWLKDIPTVPPFEQAVREILVVPEAAELFIQRAYIRKHGKRRAG